MERSPVRADIRAGLFDIAPAAIAAVPIALLYGALCQAKGMSVAEVALTSALVFAGGAQFAALEIWAQPAPVLALAFSTALVNARHLLLGASLAPKLAHFGASRRAAALFFMVDEIWALAERRAVTTRVSGAYWTTMGIVLWLNWTTSSTLGAMFGSALGDPKRFGADFAFTALFIGLVAAFWKGRATAWVIAASAAASALAHVVAGSPWHVAAGAIAGIATAAAMARPETAR